MGTRREKTEDELRVELLQQVFAGFALWEAYVEDYGACTITRGNEEFDFYDIKFLLREELPKLPLKQQQAFTLIVLLGHKEREAAQLMGYVRWSTPAQQHKNKALAHLVQVYSELVSIKDLDSTAS